MGKGKRNLNLYVFFITNIDRVVMAGLYFGPIASFAITGNMDATIRYPLILIKKYVTFFDRFALLVSHASFNGDGGTG